MVTEAVHPCWVYRDLFYKLDQNIHLGSFILVLQIKQRGVSPKSFVYCHPRGPVPLQTKLLLPSTIESGIQHFLCLLPKTQILIMLLSYLTSLPSNNVISSTSSIQISVFQGELIIIPPVHLGHFSVIEPATVCKWWLCSPFPPKREGLPPNWAISPPSSKASPLLQPEKSSQNAFLITILQCLHSAGEIQSNSFQI